MNIDQVTERYQSSDRGMFLDFLFERLAQERGELTEIYSPGWWWLAADAYEAEIGPIDLPDTIKDVVDALFSELEKHPEKTHLSFIKQYKIAQDMDI